MKEKWKNIEGFPGYQISNKGKVKSFKRKEAVILKNDINSNGYLRVRLSNKISKKVFIHKLVGIHFIDNPQNRIYLDHKNRIRTDNTASNLRWCTIEENMKNRKFKSKSNGKRN